MRIVAGTLPLEEAIDFALDTGSSGVSASVRAGVGRTADLGPLTSREREICELVAEGLSNKEIAARLVISPRTAESHVQNVMGKLGFTRRTDHRVDGRAAGRRPAAQARNLRSPMTARSNRRTVGSAQRLCTIE